MGGRRPRALAVLAALEACSTGATASPGPSSELATGRIAKVWQSLGRATAVLPQKRRWSGAERYLSVRKCKDRLVIDIHT